MAEANRILPQATTPDQARAISAAVMVLARQKAIKAVKQQIRDRGLRPQYMALREIATAGDEYLANHPELIAEAKETVLRWHALTRALAALGPGEVLLVTRLDRLARSTRDLLNVIDTIAKAGAGFRSLADAWADTTTPHGRLMLTVLGGLAEFERELIRARTDEGRKRAQARGVRFGRKLKLTAHQRAEAIARRDAGEALAEIGRSYAVSHSTISRLRDDSDGVISDSDGVISNGTVQRIKRETVSP